MLLLKRTIVDITEEVAGTIGVMVIIISPEVVVCIQEVVMDMEEVLTGMDIKETRMAITGMTHTMLEKDGVEDGAWVAMVVMVDMVDTVE